MWRRRLFVMLSALSLLLCIGVATLWIRSYRQTDVLLCGHTEIVSGHSYQLGESHTLTVAVRAYGFYSFRGGLLIVHPEDIVFKPADSLFDIGKMPRNTCRHYGWPVGESWGALGFRFYRRPPGALEITLIVPYWLSMLVTAVLPVRMAFLARGRWRCEKRRRLGLCEQCGYDLRASSGRCPECGTPI